MASAAAPAGAAPRYLRADAWQLDLFLVSFAADALRGAIDKVAGARAAGAASAEADAVAGAAVLGVPALLGLQTAGQRATGLTYAGRHRARRAVVVFAALAAQYAVARLAAAVRGWRGDPATRDAGRAAAALVNAAAAAVHAAKLLSALTFIVRGDYASLTDRVAGLRLVPAGPGGDGSPGRPQLFAVLALQVALSAAGDLVRAVRDAADWGDMAAWASRAATRTARRTARVVAGWGRALRGSTGGGGGGGDATVAGTPCAHCEADHAVMPLRANCGHTFCYFCLHGALLVHKSYECDECGAAVSAATQV
jgi:hypothetical protein